MWEGSKEEQVAILFLVWVLRGFTLMLGLGVLHNDWSTNVPALGFWGSLIVAAVIPMGLRVKSK